MKKRAIESLRMVWVFTFTVIVVCTIPLWLVIYIVTGFNPTDYIAKIAGEQPE